MRRMGWYPVSTRVILYPVMLREETHRTATVCPGQCQVFAFGSSATLILGRIDWT